MNKIKVVENKNKSEKVIAKNLLICNAREVKNVVDSIQDTISASGFVSSDVFNTFMNIMIAIIESNSREIVNNFDKSTRINNLVNLIEEFFITNNKLGIQKKTFEKWLNEVVDSLPNSTDDMFFFDDKGEFNAEQILSYYYWNCMLDNIEQIDNDVSIGYDSKLTEFKVPNIRDCSVERDIYKLGDVEEGLTQSSIYSTGVNELDNYIFFQPTNLCYVGARPSVGKSMMVMNLALDNALKGIKSLYVSLEMTPKQTRTRVNQWIKKEQEIRPVDVSLLNENIHLFDAEEVNGDYIFKKIEKFAMNNPGCIIILDHIGLVRYNGKDEWGSLRMASLQAKTIALKTKSVFVACAQASRESEISGFSMSSLFGSSTLEQDADIIIGMEPQTETKINFVIAKNRDGIKDVSMSTPIDKTSMHFV